MKLYRKATDYSDGTQLIIKKFIDPILEKKNEYHLNVSLGIAGKNEFKELRKYIWNEVIQTTKEICSLSLKEGVIFFLVTVCAILKQDILRILRKFMWFDSEVVILSVLWLIMFIIWVYMMLRLFGS